MKSALIVGLSLLTLAAAAAQSPELPHLRKQGPRRSWWWIASRF
jgi:hypothetical protein